MNAAVGVYRPHAWTKDGKIVRVLGTGLNLLTGAASPHHIAVEGRNEDGSRWIGNVVAGCVEVA